MLNFLSGGRRRETVPIFPLHAVLFPQALLPLRIFEVRYMDMARDCLRQGKPFGVCLIKEGREVGEPAVPEEVGCLARIAECDMQELGILKVTAQGVERFRIVSSRAERSGLIVGEVDVHAPESPAPEAPGLAQCAQFLARVDSAIAQARFAGEPRYDDATWVGFRLAELLPLRTDVKQKLLELTDAAMRLAVLHRFLKQQKLLAP